MKLLSIFFLAASTLALVAADLTYTTQPGCFSGTVKSVISASTDTGTRIAYPAGEFEDKEFRNMALVAQALEKIRAMEFNDAQIKFLEEQSETTGPDYCVLKYLQNNRTIEISFPAALASEKYSSLILTSKSKGFYKDYDRQDLEGLLKNIREIQTLMASLATNQAEPGGADQPATAPQSKLEGEGKPQPEKKPASR